MHTLCFSCLVAHLLQPARLPCLLSQLPCVPFLHNVMPSHSQQEGAHPSSSLVRERNCQ